VSQSVNLLTDILICQITIDSTTPNLLRNTFSCDAKRDIKNLTSAVKTGNIIDNFTFNKCKPKMQNHLQSNIHYEGGISEHPGNIATADEDVKNQNSTDGVTVDFYFDDIVNTQNYFQTVMKMPYMRLDGSDAHKAASDSEGTNYGNPYPGSLPASTYFFPKMNFMFLKF